METSRQMTSRVLATKDIPAHFRSPVATLLGSLNHKSNFSHSHNVLHAYDLFSTRVKSISFGAEPPSAVQGYLRRHSHELMECAKRDIGRVYLDCFPAKLVSAEQVPSEVPSPLVGGNEGEWKHAQDISLTCHMALRWLSNVFHFPWLLSVFSNDDIDDIVDQVLSIILTDGLPTPHERKTRALALWITSCQGLPISSLSRKKLKVSTVLKKYIAHDVRPNDYLFVADTLKIVDNLLQQDSLTFISAIHDIFPSLLSQLLSLDSDVQHAAARALGALAISARHPACSLRTQLAQALRDFVDSHVASKSGKDAHLSQPLLSLFTSALDDNSPLKPGSVGPCWAISVLASFVVLSDGLVFSQKRFLKFVVKTILPIMADKKLIVRGLGSRLWRCLVWAMFRLGDTSKRGAPQDTHIYDNAFALVNQIAQAGIGSSLVYGLLGEAPSDTEHNMSRPVSGHPDFPRAIHVLRELVKRPDRDLHEESVALLATMTSGIGSSRGSEHRGSRKWCLDRLLEPTLFDGSILRVDPTESQWEPSTTLKL